MDFPRNIRKSFLYGEADAIYNYIENEEDVSIGDHWHNGSVLMICVRTENKKDYAVPIRTGIRHKKIRCIHCKNSLWLNKREEDLYCPVCEV